MGKKFQLNCMDAFTTSFFELCSPSVANFVPPSFVDGIGGSDNSCGAGCFDRMRPLCKAGKCVMPTCKGLCKHMDALMHTSLYSLGALEHCHSSSLAGKLSRLWCPQTCGCDNALSSLWITGAQDGCAPSCHKLTEHQLKERPCTDMPAHADTLGCRSVLVEGLETCDSPYNWGKPYKNFCPVSCR